MLGFFGRNGLKKAKNGPHFEFYVSNLENDIRKVFIVQKIAKIEVLHEGLGPLSQKL